MMRRFAAFLLVFCLALSAPAAVFAQAANKGNVTTLEVGPFFLEELLLSRGTAAQPDALDQNGNPPLRSGTYVRYIDRVDLPRYAIDLYETLEEGADGDGTADILIDVTQAKTNANKTQYIVELTQFAGSFSGDSDLERIIGENLSEAGAYAYAAIGAFDRDHPEVFWISNSWSLTTTISYSGRNYTQVVYLVLKGTVSGRTYDVRSAAYTDSAVLRDAIAERDANVQAILDEMPSSAITDADKMRYFNHWLTHNNEYNTAVSSGKNSAAWEMAWECISALQGNIGTKGPVCEGYSRAFQVLCTAVGIPCVLVSGDTQDIHTGIKNGHMWNYVQLEDNWYAVDVTWNDPSGGRSGKESGYERENYLFVGANTVAVAGRRPFLTEHPVENNIFAQGVYFTNGPVLSSDAYANAHIHTFGSPVFRWAADSKSAVAVFTCTEDSSHTMEIDAAVTSAVKTAPACETMGTTEYTAVAAWNGKNYKSVKDMKDIPALGHDWGEWVQTKEPTDTETGEAVRTCLRDPNHTDTKVLPELTHEHHLTLVPERAPTTTEEGSKAYYICDGCELWFEDAEGETEITEKESVILPVLPTTGLPGDVNQDGKVNSVDYMLLKRYVLGTYSFNDVQTAVADVNHDDKINSVDYMLLKRYVLGTYSFT